MDLNRVNNNNFVMMIDSSLDKWDLKRVVSVDLEQGTIDTDYEDAILAEDIKGIPLTKNVLDCVNSILPYLKEENSSRIELVTSPNDTLIINFNFLHDLQNLHMLLANSELDIDTKKLSKILEDDTFNGFDENINSKDYGRL